MNIAVVALIAAGIVSFFSDFLILSPGGPYLAITLGVASAVIPVITDDMMKFILFKPDVMVTPDPLEPNSGTVAKGIKIAMDTCVHEARNVNLLISQIPGSIVELSLNAVRRRCYAEISGSVTSRREEDTLPAFTTGSCPAWFQIGKGDFAEGLRLVLRFGSKDDERIKCEEYRAPFAWVIGMTTFFILIVFLFAGVKTALAILPCVLAGGLFAWKRRGPLGALFSGCSFTKRQLIFSTVTCVTIVWNLVRFGVL